MNLKEEFGIEPEIIAEAFNKGFWFKESESLMTPFEMERFKWKNSSFYDEEHKLFFQTGVEASHGKVIFTKPVLSVSYVGDTKVYYFTAFGGYAVLPLTAFKKTWAINKEDLISPIDAMLAEHISTNDRFDENEFDTVKCTYKGYTILEARLNPHNAQYCIKELGFKLRWESLKNCKEYIKIKLVKGK